MLVNYLQMFMRLLHAPAIFDYAQMSSHWCSRYWGMLLVSLMFVYGSFLFILLCHRKYFHILPHWLSELFETMLGNREEGDFWNRDFKCIGVAAILFVPLVYILSWGVYGFVCAVGWPVPR